MNLPIADRAALAGMLRISVGEPSNPQERMQYFADKMQEVSGIDVKKRSRDRETVTARCLFMFVARREGYSQSDIGRFVGRDHATVCHAENRVKDMFSFPNAYKEEINLYNKYIESL